MSSEGPSFKTPASKTQEKEKKYSPEEIRNMQEKVKGNLNSIHLGFRAAMTGRGQYGQEPITSGTWYEVGGSSDSVCVQLKSPEHGGERAKPSLVEVSRSTPGPEYFIDSNDGKIKAVNKSEIKADNAVGKKEILVIKENGEASFTTSEVIATKSGTYEYRQLESAQLVSDPEKIKDPEKVLDKINEVNNNAIGHPELKVSQRSAF